MIELIFVIVVLGILAAIAVPKLAATRDDAHIAKGRANVLAIRSGIISERQGRMFRGNSAYATDLNSSTGAGVELFGNIMTQPVISKAAGVDGGWRKTGNKTYAFHVLGQDVIFTYDDTTGIFTCDRANGTYGKQCQALTE
jgi:general secretion pathway protein G